jgi:diguanylate cyclase (GGDEF)-like protein
VRTLRGNGPIRFLRPPAVVMIRRQRAHDARDVDLASLEERLGFLLVVRLAAVLYVVGLPLLGQRTGARASTVALLSAVYLAGAVTIEWWCRRGPGERIELHRSLLPVDSLFLVVVTDGDALRHASLVFLLSGMLVAVTLLASARTGLRIAAWDAAVVLLFPAFSLAQPLGRFLGYHGPPLHSPETTAAFDALRIVLITLAVAACSSVSERELRRSRKYLAVMADMASEMEEADRPGDTLEILLRSVLETFSFNRGVLLWGERGQVTVFSGATRAGTVTVSATSERGFGLTGDEVARQVLAGRRPLLRQRLDPLRDPLAARAFPDARNLVVLPLSPQGEQDGCLILEFGGRRDGQRFPRRTLAMLTQYVTHAGLVMRNATLLAEQERMANIDGLTGLDNRRQFDRGLVHEIRVAKESNRPLTLALLDVDHFKAVNDQRGHLAGDEVLRRLAGAMKRATRHLDTVARFGGEEFAVILPNCPGVEAVRVLERVEAEIRRDPELDGITLSVGLATSPDVTDDAVTLLAAADAAMYRSKRDGRNTLTVATLPSEPEARSGVVASELSAPPK